MTSPAPTTAPAPGTTRVACCQLPITIGDAERNRATTRSAIIEASDAGARVIVLPELATSGYMFQDVSELHAAAETIDGPGVSDWVRLAAERDLIIIGGFAEAGEDGNVYNSAALVDSSGARVTYRKTHLWNFEKHVFTPGSGLPPVVDTAVGRIGVMICYDLEFPELSRSVGLRGAQLLAAPVNWPLYPRPEGERPTEVVKAQANAIVNRMFVAAADRTGTERGQEWLGGTVIVDADGFPVTGIAPGREMIVYADLDLSDALNKVISENNDVQKDRRPELYGDVTGTAR